MPVEVEDFEPDNGAPGERITVIGSGFVRNQTTVTFFMDAPGTAVFVEDGETLSVVLPEGARTGIVRARSPNGDGASVKSFTVDQPGPVRVQRFQPTSGVTDEQIKIFGQGFSGGKSVKFGPYQCTKIRWVSDNEIVAAVPSNAKKGNVRIEVTAAQGTGKSPVDFSVK